MEELNLTPRMIEIVIMVGRDQRPYKAVARILANKHREGERISVRTVEKYAERIRDRIGSTKPPRAAITAFYWTHRAELDPAA